MSSTPATQAAPASTDADLTDKDAVQTALEDTPARNLAYASRIRTFLLAQSRYVAYTSDIGESFRPLVTPAVVRAGYAVSWAYLLGDVGYAGWRTWKEGGRHAVSHAHAPSPSSSASSASAQAAQGAQGAISTAVREKDELRRRLGTGVQSSQDAKDAAQALAHEGAKSLRTPGTGAGAGTTDASTSGVAHAPPKEVAFVMARRAVFQTLASMALPAFTIHSVVRYSAPLFARSASRRLASLGPTVAGLACVPALPYIFDHPVEHAVDVVFDKIEEVVDGK